jgi:hypothetical protein
MTPGERRRVRELQGRGPVDFEEAMDLEPGTCAASFAGMRVALDAEAWKRAYGAYRDASDRRQRRRFLRVWHEWRARHPEATVERAQVWDEPAI